MKSAYLLTTLAAAVIANSSPDPLMFGAFEEHALEARQDTGVDANGQIVVNALYNIGNATQALGSQIDTFTLDTLLPLNTASLNVVNLINQAIANVSAITGTLTTGDAIALTTIIQQLAKTVNSTVTSAINKKQDFGGAAFVVYDQFLAQQSATTTFSLDVVKILPSEFANASALLTAPIFSSLAAGVAVFKEPNVNSPEAFQSLSTYSSGASASARLGLGSVAGLAVAVSMFLL